jgi:peptidoglycan/LPS O-acetylase OafA/YrhL
MSAPSASRIPQLDLLRGCAVLLVIAYHYHDSHFLSQVGWAGVDLFFVLSGFLISGLLFSDWQKHGRLSIGRFFIRRGFKIYPAFYVFLLLTLPITITVYRWEVPSRFAAECLFLQDYIPHLWGHTWSLGVEEQFYILLPLLLLALSRLWPSSAHRGFRLIPYISLALLVGCLVLRVQAHAQKSIDLLSPLHFRADSLFAGVTLGYWFHFHNDSFRALSRWWFLPASLTLLLPLAIVHGIRFLPFVLTANTLAFTLLVCWILPRPTVRFRLLEKVGFYSYSIYLWHMAVTMFAILLPLNFAMLCINLVACCGTGIYMSNAIEKPALALRERLFPADAAPIHASRPTLSVVAP